MFFEMNLGGGGSLDFFNPDVKWMGDLTSTGTHSITVTKKPRYIAWGIVRSSSAYLGGLLVADCTTREIRMLWYGASGYVDDTTTFTFADRIPTCTDTTVTLKGNGSYTTRNLVAIYY